MDKITTTFCFGCGIPFIVIKSNQFKWMITTIGHYDPRYVCAIYEKLRTLLNEMKHDFIKDLNSVKENLK